MSRGPSVASKLVVMQTIQVHSVCAVSVVDILVHVLVSWARCGEEIMGFQSRLWRGDYAVVWAFERSFEHISIH